MMFVAVVLVVSRTACGGVKDGTLDIYWVDVEGGGATLVITPDGESVLIDTGSAFERDAGRIFKVAKETAGLTRIDHLVVTHFHSDHFGGAAELAALLPIGQVYDNGIPETDPDHRPDNRTWAIASQPYRHFASDARHVIEPGAEIALRQRAGALPLRLRCVAARQRFAEPRTEDAANPLPASVIEKPADLTDNANSIALLLGFGPFRFFDGGDLTWNTEATLVCPINRVGTVDVYQVDHHGLDVSNNPIFVHTLAPTVCVMNNGARKGTEASTCAALRTSPGLEALYQLHKNLRADVENNTSDELIANLEENCSANFIKLAVASDGRSYNVTIPARSHAKTYRTRAGQ